MFIVDTDPTFTHTVTARVPIDGGFEEQAFTATYGLMPSEEFEKLDLNNRADSLTFFNRIVRSLGDIAGKDGKPIPFSDKLRAQAYALPWARVAILRGYFEAIGRSAAGN